MPRVPTYDSFQAQPTALPATGLRVPDFEPTAAQGAQELGAGLTRGGNALAGIALDAQNQANQVRLLDAMNQVKEAELLLTHDKDQGYSNLKGRNALERPDGKALDAEYGEKFDTRIRAIRDSLGNETQRRSFDLSAARMRAEFGARINQHMAQEFKVHQGGVYDGAVQTATDSMALNHDDPQQVQQSRRVISGAVYEKGKLLGWSALQTQAALTDALSKGNAAVIASATTNGKLDYAREYYLQVKDEFTPEARLQMQKLLDAGDFERRTQDKADAVFSRSGGDMAAALAEVRRTMSGKEEDAVITRLKTLDAERVALRERTQKDAADQAWRVYSSTGNLNGIPPAVIAAMDGRDLDALRRTARAAAEAAASGSEIKTDPSVYYALSMAAAQDPNFKNEDLRRYFDKLAPADRKHMIDLQAKAARSEDAAEVATTQQQIAATVKALRLKDEDAGVFTMQAHKSLLAAQQEKGKPLDQTERQKVLDRITMEGSTPGAWWGMNSTRAFQADAQGRAFTPKFSDADVRKAMAALQRAGVQSPTREQIDATIKSVYGIK